MTSNKSSKNGEKKKNYSIIGFIILFLIGAGILFYPKISFWLADYNTIMAHQSYERAVGDLSNEEKQAMWEEAVHYNERLVKSVVEDPFANTDEIDPFDEYYQTLDVGDGEMGYIHIPKINVLLPIYHGVSDTVLDKGVGHIKATALPVGGDGTHCVLTGHTGLTHAKMFNDLVELEKEDEFFLEILDETLAYKVVDIKVVLPDDISSLHREAGKDKVTLVTCTPYGVNSHRLLVTGERSEYNEEANKLNKESKVQFPWGIVAAVVGILIMILIIKRTIDKYKDENSNNKSSNNKNSNNKNSNSRNSSNKNGSNKNSNKKSNCEDNV